MAFPSSYFLHYLLQSSCCLIIMTNHLFGLKRVLLFMASMNETYYYMTFTFFVIPNQIECSSSTELIFRDSYFLFQQEYSTQLTFREEWQDDRLMYDDQQGQIRFLTLTDQEKIWKPDLFFRNEKDGHLHEIIMPNVLLRIYPDGRVLYSIRISLVLACPMDLKYYPLDRQTCMMSMASCEYLSHNLLHMILMAFQSSRSDGISRVFELGGSLVFQEHKTVTQTTE